MAVDVGSRLSYITIRRVVLYRLGSIRQKAKSVGYGATLWCYVGRQSFIIDSEIAPRGVFGVLFHELQVRIWFYVSTLAA